MKNKIKYWVYDYETYYNCFIAVYESLTSDERHIFIIHKSKNQLIELIDFLKQNIINKDWHLGYNCLAFDSQITEYILDNYERFEYATEDEITLELHKYANYVIKKSDSKEFLDYPEFKLQIQNVDVYRINHWDNQNKRSSLKWIQFSMDWENIEETPHDFRTPVETQEELNSVINYCINDVASTKKIFKLSVNAINLRLSLQHKYKINCINYSNTKIGSELLLKLYCDKTGYDKKEIKNKGGTKRTYINLKDIIFPYISFTTTPLQKLLLELKELTIYNTKGDFSKIFKYKNCEFNLGLGGLHQSQDSSIYLSNDEFIIIDADVASLYPSIAVINKMYPKHLGPQFYEVYKNDIVDVRLAEKAKKDKGDKAIIEGFKESANASYGNSNQQYSWLFDSSYTMETTVNGQLLLLMLVEDLLANLSDSLLIQSNTDGITLRLKRTEVDKYYEICKKWEEITKLQLEFATYTKMIISDVNSYIAVYEDNTKKPKCKGRFEWEDLQTYKATHLHKNKSNLIVPKAIYNYFINNIKPENYLKENRNIFDYCSGVKAKGDWRFWKLAIEKGQYTEEKLQKVIRYYISNKGCKIVKRHSDNREIQTESGEWMQTIFNKYIELPWEDYHVNDKYYLDKIYSEIYNIQGPGEDKPKQLTFNF